MITQSPDNIKKYREKAELTQTQAAEKIHRSMRAWQQWEAGERKMPLDSWELFLIKTGQNE